MVPGAGQRTPALEGRLAAALAALPAVEVLAVLPWDLPSQNASIGN